MFHRVMRFAPAAVTALAFALAGSAPAQGAPAHRADRVLVRVHHCQPMSKPLRPPVAGYVIGLHSNPSAPLFYRSVDNLTAGLFYGQGGDWVMRYWCKR